jgi:hypothetical protein
MNWDKREAIEREIERVREQMVKLGAIYGFLHPDVQRCSKQLDSLLIQFYTLRNATEHTP